MSQPETSTTSGAEALLAASTGKAPRRTRHVPTPKPEAAASKQAPPAPQQPPAAPEPAGQSPDTQEAPPAPQRPAEPPATPDAPPQQDAPPPQTPDAGAAEESQGSAGKEVMFPARPLDYQDLFAPKPKSTVDPAMLAMLTERQIKLLKSLRNVITMFNERHADYASAVATAKSLGMSEEDMMRIAVTHECEPILRALLHDGESSS